MTSYSLQQLAEMLGAELHGDAHVEVSSVATLSNAGKGQISFLANSKYRQQLTTTQADAVLLTADDLDVCQCNALVMKNPYVGYAKLAQILDSTPPPAREKRAANVVIDATANVSESAYIGANSVIAAGAVIEDDCIIGANCFIGENSQLGAGTRLWANVSIYHGVTMGKNCLVQSGTAIGSDGFGYANDAGRWIKIPQVGGVVIGDDCEIGANTCIDRGALDDTVIGNNVILDNQLQIAHNVHIGDGTAMAACTVVAGSTTIGKGCTIAGACGINGHIEIVDNVHLTGMSMVTKNIKQPGVYSSGMPSMGNKEWRKTMVRFKQLDDIHKRIKALEAISAEQLSAQS